MIPDQELIDKKITVKVHLYDRKTKERRVIDHGPYEWWYRDKYDEINEASFIWEEGNYSCDCNRLLFMYGQQEGQDCNQKPYSDARQNRVIVEKICLPDGREVYSEDTPEELPL